MFRCKRRIAMTALALGLALLASQAAVAFDYEDPPAATQRGEKRDRPESTTKEPKTIALPSSQDSSGNWTTPHVIQWDSDDERDTGESAFAGGGEDSKTVVDDMKSGRLEWKTGSWGSCRTSSSKSCGSVSGHRTRSVVCRLSSINGGNQNTGDSLCVDVLGSKPSTRKSCSINRGSCSTSTGSTSGGSSRPASCSGSYGSTMCQMYEDTFGRTPDSAGADYWMDEISNKGYDLNNPDDAADLQQRFEDGASGSDCTALGKQPKPGGGCY